MAKILVVDDNVDMLDTLEHLFVFYDYEVLRAENGRVGLEIAETQQPGLIILDALMPVMNGFEACEQLKRNLKTKDIPVIFLSANYTENLHRLKGFELGADDYMLKPFNAKELIAKVNALIHRKNLLDNLRQNNISVVSGQATDLFRTVFKTDSDLNSVVDDLTGLYNRKFLEILLEQQSHRRHSLIVADVDNFSHVNDTFGELSGDYALVLIANILLKNTHAQAVTCRINNDKFASLLPDTDETDAYRIGEALRKMIAETAFFGDNFFLFKRQSSRRKNEAMTITVSLGVSCNMDGTNGMEMLHYSEKAMQAAKKIGPNMTLKYSDLKNHNWSDSRH